MMHIALRPVELLLEREGGEGENDLILGIQDLDFDLTL